MALRRTSTRWVRGLSSLLLVLRSLLISARPGLAVIDVYFEPRLAEIFPNITELSVCSSHHPCRNRNPEPCLNQCGHIRHRVKHFRTRTDSER